MNHHTWKNRVRAKHQAEAKEALAWLKAVKAKLPSTAPAAYHSDLAELEAKCEARVTKALATAYAYEARFNAAIAQEFARQAEAKVTKALNLYGREAS